MERSPPRSTALVCVSSMRLSPKQSFRIIFRCVFIICCPHENYLISFDSDKKRLRLTKQNRNLRFFEDGEPIKLPENLESLPRADHFPNIRHRWNTNEVSDKLSRFLVGVVGKINLLNDEFYCFSLKEIAGILINFDRHAVRLKAWVGKEFVIHVDDIQRRRFKVEMIVLTNSRFAWILNFQRDVTPKLTPGPLNSLVELTLTYANFVSFKEWQSKEVKTRYLQQFFMSLRPGMWKLLYDPLSLSLSPLQAFHIYIFPGKLFRPLCV